MRLKVSIVLLLMPFILTACPTSDKPKKNASPEMGSTTESNQQSMEKDMGSGDSQDMSKGSQAESAETQGASPEGKSESGDSEGASQEESQGENTKNDSANAPAPEPMSQ